MRWFSLLCRKCPSHLNRLNSRAACRSLYSSPLASQFLKRALLGTLTLIAVSTLPETSIFVCTGTTAQCSATAKQDQARPSRFLVWQDICALFFFEILALYYVFFLGPNAELEEGPEDLKGLLPRVLEYVFKLIARNERKVPSVARTVFVHALIYVGFSIRLAPC